MTALEREVRPRGPFSLALSARRAQDATRRFDERRVLTAAVPDGASASVAYAWQRPDGTLVLRAASTEALDRLRFVLALDADHAEFLRRFAHDPLLGEATRRLRGLRPLRGATVAHALLRAFCGQLIDSRRARAIEMRVVRAISPVVDSTRLHAPPTGVSLGRASPADLRALGLHARRAASLVRVCRALDLERLRDHPTGAVVERLVRERGLGPWSLGVVCLEGLGRYEHGLVGDLGLVKLLAELRGRRVDASETAELLAPYGEWAGLASEYLLTAYGAGLIPLAGRRPRIPIRDAAAA